jgi:hypothetical protein
MHRVRLYPTRTQRVDRTALDWAFQRFAARERERVIDLDRREA